ncbi:sigma factor binding protein 1, chloroplastic-like [Telopea speciosissima]|uniref:sigma factor binding protein 1, chloroplastic-like n=1 Tax=Telopea speciosissima TaxID=54955 RepID=UPI001CC5D4B8|nr:sigma factor binding protein 1, chloroplastic-like [Telopea speciosissima]
MDKLSVHQGIKCSKQSQSKKKSKPIKVVYISNPMKVKTSASEFRALVQELTGRDSDLSRITVDGRLQKVPVYEVMKSGDDEYEPQVPHQIESYQESSLPGKSDEVDEPFDDHFTSVLLENFIY